MSASARKGKSPIVDAGLGNGFDVGVFEPDIADGPRFLRFEGGIPGALENEDPVCLAAAKLKVGGAVEEPDVDC